MKPWFEKEADIIKFPKPKAKVIRMPTVQEYPDFITGVKDLQAKQKDGTISQETYNKLYSDLIHRFMKKESFEKPWFIREAPAEAGTVNPDAWKQSAGIMGTKQATAGKLDFIKDKISQGEVTDPKTIDFIYKILNKENIKGAINSLVSNIDANDQDVANFRKLNQGVFSKLIRKMPVKKEELDAFLTQWSTGHSFVDTARIKNGARGTIKDLISSTTALKAFEIFESVRSQYRMPKKGSTGYGEFGMAMLSPQVRMIAPGDIEINGAPIEVKGNDARLFADERAMAKASESIAEARGDSPGLINNVHKELQNPDAKVRKQTVQNVANAFKSRGMKTPEIKQIIANAQKKGSDPMQTLGVAWWTAGFNYYQMAIKMPVLVMGKGLWLISNKANDFIKWGCLPTSQSNYGYMFGRQAGQSRETFPKIFIPGYNK